ncbi:hypothetical protein Q3G72_022652 [Acer saccharum]|nr:hypothetical protein Q3G72_022652 [Acer saccharum]
MMQKWFHEHRSKAKDWTTQLSEWATEKVTKRSGDSLSYDVQPIDFITYHVKDGGKNVVVDMQNKTYSCRVWDLQMLPYPDDKVSSGFGPKPTEVYSFVRCITTVVATNEFSKEPSDFALEGDEDEWPIEPISDIGIHEINVVMFK